MKRMKTLLALVLSVVMALALMMPAMATDDGKGCLTITNTTAGEDYKLYRVLDATHNGNSAYYYTINARFQGFFNDISAAKPEDGGDATAESVYTYISTMNEAAKRTLAKDLAKYVLDPVNGVEPIDTYTATGTSYEVDNLDYGYYLLVPDKDKTTGSVIFSLSTLGSTANIQNKTTYPAVVKEVKGPHDQNYGKTTIAGAGDVLDFEIEGTVPNMYGYESYTFKIHDKLSKMTFKSGTDKLKIGTKSLTRGDDYTIVVEDGKTMMIDIKDFIKYTPGDNIKLEYQAILDNDAVVGNPGNDNTASFEYSNDPLAKTTGMSTSDKTTVFSLKLTLHKVAENGETPLKGSTWSLYKYSNSQETLVGTIDTADLSDFTWERLGPGRYHLKEVTAPNGYRPLQNQIVISLSGTGEISSTGTSSLTTVSISNEAHNHVVRTPTSTPADGATEITVKNSHHVELPSTGGAGLYVIAGVAFVALLGFGGTALIKRKVNGAD